MEEDDYADIEWSETTLENYNNNDNNSNNHGDIQETSAPSTVIECEKQRRNTSRSTSLYTKEDKRIAARIHKTHLLILLSSLQKLDELASDPFVMGCCLSIVPRDCLWSEEDNIQTQEEWKEKCRRLMLFCIRFVLGNHNQLSTREVFSSHYAFWQPLHMLQWLESPRPLASIFVVFVCAIFRGLGMRCRLVQSLMPFPKQPWWTKEDETSVAKTKVSNRARHLKMARQDCNDNFLWCWLLTPWWMELELPTSRHKKRRSKQLSFDSIPCVYWLEVYCPWLQRWVSIDPLHMWIDEPSLVESSWKQWKWHPFGQRKLYPVYITAIEQGIIRNEETTKTTIWRDVTLRYVSADTITSQRIGDEFWEETIKALSPCVALDSCIMNEEREWKELELDIPKSISKLKGHPKYVLEIHLKKYEAIYPKDRILGYCGPHAVYPRSHVHILHTRDGWIREMRQVKKDQVAWKIVPKTTRGKESGSTTELFGIWQTETFIPPSIQENGQVPKNERGQVDLWSRNHLPLGCVHVKYSNAAKIAKHLGIDYAPAMVGFDIIQGRSVPILDGIVVAKEYQEILEDACLQDDQRKASEQMKQRYQQALLLWKACIRHVQSQLGVGLATIFASSRIIVVVVVLYR